MSEPGNIVTSSATWRFVRRGIADAESRVGRLASPAPTSDDLVVRLLRGSLLVRTIELAVAAVGAAAATSRAVRTLRATIAPARDLPIAARQRLAGLAIVATVASHLLFAFLGDRPTGWSWLILPSIAAAVALLLMAVVATPTSGSR